MIKITNILASKAALLPVALMVGLAGCGSDSDKADSNQVDIDYTTYGVPHITADNYEALSYGQGYAHAQDNMCTLAEQIINVRAERSATFGAGGGLNIADDFGILGLGVYQQAQDSFDTLSTDHKDVLNGYVKGFNAAVAAKGGFENYPSPCGELSADDWVPTVSNIDLHAFHLRLALLASGDALRQLIGSEGPTTPAAPSSISKNDITAKITSIGSNGWALGKNKTEGGKGMLLSNPHFPWAGHLRLVQSHLKMPGELNVTGVGFVGVPGVLIGFNENMAWTHTVSQSKKMTLYTLELDPANHLRYKFGDAYLDMTSQEHTINVKGIGEMTKTLYSTHYGPMISWDYFGTGQVMTYRDANVGNINIVPQWLAMNKAKNLAEFKQAFIDHQGDPWVNTIATDTEGNAFYIDASRTANLLPPVDDGIKTLLNTPLAYLPAETQPIAGALQSVWQEGKGQLVLSGSDPLYSWWTDPSTPVAGTVSYKNSPKLTSDDYVFNANSSHWLSNTEEPLEGYSIVYGPEGTIRSPRTRMNAKLITEVSATGVSGADGKFSLTELKNVVTGGRGLSSELLRDQVAVRCAGKSNVTVNAVTVDISTACTVITNWDGLYTNESIGAHVFRELMNGFKSGTESVLDNDLFETAFSAAAPMTTPSGLKPRANDATDDTDPILIALANAVTSLTTNNVDLDAALGDVQFHTKNDVAISIPGGSSVDGVFNINAGSLKDGGYEVTHGASWVMALEFTEDGPVADAWLTYGQSHDPESENFSDQTELFSEGSWRPVLFTDAAIEEGRVGETTTLTME
jgi:acyl-homoserine-lactone acylase